MIDHPWAISTCNFAELYYRLAHEITAAGTRSRSTPTRPSSSTRSESTASRPRRPRLQPRCEAAGDQMLQAIIFHSDHLELSEQFDANTGYEKSVSNLSWSYASFLSAVRAR